MKKSIIYTDRSVGSFDTFLKEISKYKPLDTSEEFRLWQLMRQGDSEARERLITSNLRYVVSVAKQFQGYDIPLEDLVGAGNVGIIIAADKFDATLGVRFISYADYYIKNEIRRMVSKTPSTLSLDAPLYEDDDCSTTIGDLMACDDQYESDWNLRYTSELDNFMEIARANHFDEAAEFLDDYFHMTQKGYLLADVARKHGLTEAYARQLLRNIGTDCRLALKMAA